MALSRVLNFYSRSAAAARDDVSEIIGRGRVTKALERLRADSARCIDGATIARELLEFSEDGFKYLHEMEFTERIENYRNSRHDMTPNDLMENRRLRYIASAKSLLANVEELNSGLNAQANLLSAHSNLRLQPWIIILAIVSALAGIVAAAEPIAEIVSPKTAIEIKLRWVK